MDKVLSNEVVADVLSMRLKLTKVWQKCSFILPDGRFVKLIDHNDAFKFLVAEGLCPCVPDAEILLSDLGYVRYSYMGYITLPEKPLTLEQYKSLEITLMNLEKYCLTKDAVSVQLQNQPRVYVNYPLDDIPYIIERIKYYYKTGKLRI